VGFRCRLRQGKQATVCHVQGYVYSQICTFLGQRIPRFRQDTKRIGQKLRNQREICPAEQSLAYIFYYVKAKQGGCRGNPSDLAQFPLLAYSYFNFWDHTRAVPVPERRSVVSTIYQLMNSKDTFLILRNLRHPAQRSYEGPFCWADGSTDITMPRTMM
jgi:hypothetical protein